METSWEEYALALEDLLKANDIEIPAETEAKRPGNPGGD